MSEQMIEEIELNIQEAKKIVELGDALERLISNRDFDKVFTDGYLREEAIRLVHLKGDPNLQDAESQKMILGQMDAIGNFTSYIQKVRHAANTARKAIEADEETREELLAEGAE